MDTNSQAISQFYTAFQNLDDGGMVRCYGEEIFFFDPVFGFLKDQQVAYMWEMLCANAKDFSLEYGNIVALDHEYYTCDWTATYTFSQTGRKVVNRVKANMKFFNGKIIEHSDAFSLHQWSRQALGWPGAVFGWNSFFQRKIQNKAKRSLLKFINAKGL